MILEAAILYVETIKQKDFEKDFAFAGQYISSIKGYRGQQIISYI